MGEVTYETQPAKPAIPAQPAVHVTRFEWKIGSREDVPELNKGNILNSNEFTLNESEMEVGLQLGYQKENDPLSLQLILMDLGSAEIRDIQ
jgi:hypothetical protein